MILMTMTTATHETSDSNSTTIVPFSPIRFKGVVLQQNGHWGAQIYANHGRIWLGTFKSDTAAAMAYDSAAMKLRHGDSHRNFPWTDSTFHESSFQELFTVDAVLSMIRDGSYESKFTEFLRIMQSSSSKPVSEVFAADTIRDYLSEDGVVYRELFVKELTPSDVGKLNRLVIPKKHAVRYFPRMLEAVEEMVLEFVDREEKAWVFRYCYWKSSQSFVFTKGWNRFVKEKNLKAKDVVLFYQCEEKEGMRRTYYMIDVAHASVVVDGGVRGKGDEVVELQLGLRGEEEGKVVSGPMVEKEVRLFGVRINW